MATEIPPHFDEAFLSWFQERAEEIWQRYKTKMFEALVAGGVGRSSWQKGTRWLGALREQEIAAIGFPARPAHERPSVVSSEFDDHGGAAARVPSGAV